LGRRRGGPAQREVAHRDEVLPPQERDRVGCSRRQCYWSGWLRFFFSFSIVEFFGEKVRGKVI